MYEQYLTKPSLSCGSDKDWSPRELKNDPFWFDLFFFFFFLLLLLFLSVMDFCGDTVKMLDNEVKEGRELRGQKVCEITKKNRQKEREINPQSERKKCNSLNGKWKAAGTHEKESRCVVSSLSGFYLFCCVFSLSICFICLFFSAFFFYSVFFFDLLISYFLFFLFLPLLSLSLSLSNFAQLLNK